MTQTGVSFEPSLLIVTFQRVKITQRKMDFQDQNLDI